MSIKLIPACATPSTPSQRDDYRWAVETFAPELRFDPHERFFPVDIDTTIAASSLYRFDKLAEPPVWSLIKNQGGIQPPDLTASDADYFTSVTPLVTVSVGSPGILRLKPDIDAIETLHNNRTIASRLTMYGVICRAGGVPNSHLFEDAAPRDKDVALAVKEGYLLSYYFFFPAAFAPDKDSYYEAEGDWAGISLLFWHLPTQNNVAQESPVLCCYYRKHGEYYVSDQEGFSKWADVERRPDTSTGINTHPVVYISQGLHNCFYKPQNTIVPDVPWSPWPDIEKVEAGDYMLQTGFGTITGTFDPELPEWMFAVFGPAALLFEFCAEMGCVEFDSSGLPALFGPTPDIADKGGHTAQPPGAQPQPGSDIPPGKLPPGGNPSELLVTPVYVDLTNQQVKDQWAFAGHWGAAEMHRYSYLDKDSAKKDSYEYFSYGGGTRPLLPAWFMWNLFFDVTFGTGAITTIP